MSGKTTPSKSLGKVQLSSGTIEAINLGKRSIPSNIDYSYIDPQYYQHKLQGKTNKDMILKNLSKSEEFAKAVAADLRPLPMPAEHIPAPAPAPIRETDNKEKIRERKTQPFLCECGCTINWDEKARHRKSKKHINLMEQKQEQN